MWQQCKTWIRSARWFWWKSKSSGERGERLAESYLRRKGYDFVARNWRDPQDRRDEIDLVFREREVIVFVEVKTRAVSALVPGFYAVDRRKKRVVLRAAKAYLRLLRPRPHSYRFDVVEVTLSTGAQPEVRHYENVELFPKDFRP